MPSPTLTALFSYTKKGNSSFSWRDIRTVLAPIYHDGMALRDVLQVTVRAYEEALMEPRYAMPAPNSAGLNLLLAPLNRHSPPFERGWPQLDSTLTYEQMYDAFLAHMLAQLMVARVDWLQAESAPQQGELSAIA